MVTTAGRQRNVKEREDGLRTRRTADPGAAQRAVADQLEELARHGARTILMVTLNEEVDAYLGRGRYERSGDQAAEGEDGFRGYRNGSSPRRLTLCSGTIDLAMPRVREIPDGQEPFAWAELQLNG